MKPPETKAKLRRGFASMSPERQKEIASKGGKSVPPENRSFAVNRSLAQSAGRKGGSVKRADGRSEDDVEA